MYMILYNVQPWMEVYEKRLDFIIAYVSRFNVLFSMECDKSIYCFQR